MHINDVLFLQRILKQDSRSRLSLQRPCPGQVLSYSNRIKYPIPVLPFLDILWNFWLPSFPSTLIHTVFCYMLNSETHCNLLNAVLCYTLYSDTPCILVNTIQTTAEKATTTKTITTKKKNTKTIKTKKTPPSQKKLQEIWAIWDVQLINELVMEVLLEHPRLHRVC